MAGLRAFGVGLRVVWELCCVLFGRDVVRVGSEMSGSGWPAAASALARAAKKKFLNFFWT